MLTDNVSIEIRLQPEGRPERVLELDDPSRVTVVEFTIQPGAIFPWHTHPGPALAAVEQGELVYIYADDCVERPYPAGTMFIDPGGDNIHSAFNPSESEETIVVATILNAPDEGALTLPVDDAENQRLDQKCGIQR
jgi:quercetin dioxygenase-like cupin family protein